MALIHDRLATAALLFSLAAAAWMLLRALRGRGLDGSSWGVLAAGEALFVSQGLVGAWLWLAGLRPARGIHLLYGVAIALTLPAAYVLTRGRDDRRAAWLYGGLCLFLAGLALRARSTG